MRFRLGCSAFDTTDFGIFFHAWTSETLTPQVVAPGSARRLERTNSGLADRRVATSPPMPLFGHILHLPQKTRTRTAEADATFEHGRDGRLAVPGSRQAERLAALLCGRSASHAWCRSRLQRSGDERRLVHDS